jgi:NodT family efflux transporter outer membrane factor (OMF) lipoprotein
MKMSHSLFVKSVLTSILTGSLCLTSGCTKVGPDYVQPTASEELAMEVTTGEYLGVLPERADIANWWKIFEDPLLSDLVNEAVANNHDLRIAISRVTEARAQLGITSSDYLPTVDANGAATRTQRSEAVTGTTQNTHAEYGLSMDATWEIDVFGRVARLVEASTADFQATEEDRNDILITLCADVARVYFSVRTLQSRVRTTERNIEAQVRIVTMTRDKYEVGLASSMEVSQATRTLATSQATLPPLRTTLQENLSSLSVLLGQEPGKVLQRLNPPQDVPLPPAEVAIGIPAEQIRKRPDVRAAERRLAAQTARIGVATADLYPTFFLNGSMGTAAISSGDLFTGGASAFSFGPGVKLNIFNRQRTRDLIKVEDARTEQAMAAYEKSLIMAVKDIEDSLVAYHEQQLQMVALNEALAAAKDTRDKAEYLYNTGLTDFLNVLDAERSLLVTENDWEQGRGNTSIILARVYKSLAGGWTSEEPVPAPQVQTESTTETTTPK